MLGDGNEALSSKALLVESAEHCSVFIIITVIITIIIMIIIIIIIVVIIIIVIMIVTIESPIY